MDTLLSGEDSQESPWGFSHPPHPPQRSLRSLLTKEGTQYFIYIFVKIVNISFFQFDCLMKEPISLLKTVFFQFWSVHQNY